MEPISRSANAASVVGNTSPIAPSSISIVAETVSVLLLDEGLLSSSLL